MKAPQSSFFIKIYISFLLTIIFTIGLMMVLDKITGSGPLIDRLQHDVDRSVSFYAHESLSIYQTSGLKSLNEFALRLEKSTGIKIFLFDHTGKEITGREVPEDVRAVAIKSGKKMKTEFAFDGKSSMAARRLLDANDNIYVFAAVFPNPLYVPSPDKRGMLFSERPPAGPGGGEPPPPPPQSMGFDHSSGISDANRLPLPPPQLMNKDDAFGRHYSSREQGWFPGFPLHLLYRIIAVQDNPQMRIGPL